MIITPDVKIAKIINYNYHTLPIFSRLGMCTGFEEMTLTDFANKFNVSIYLLVELINTFINKNYLPNENNLNKFTLTELIKYLQKTHTEYLETLKHIENLLSALITEYADKNQKSISLILDFFREYKQELINHINYEDTQIYPHIIELEQAYLSNKNLTSKYNYDLETYLQEHINVEEKIVDIKTIILKYLPIKQNTRLCYQLISEIYDFEKDLIEHQRLEELILLPKAIQLENKLIK